MNHEGHKEHKENRTQRFLFMKYAPVPIETERVASETIGAAIEVHRHLGPGFLEKISIAELPRADAQARTKKNGLLIFVL